MRFSLSTFEIYVLWRLKLQQHHRADGWEAAANSRFNLQRHNDSETLADSVSYTWSCARHIAAASLLCIFGGSEASHVIGTTLVEDGKMCQVTFSI